MDFLVKMPTRLLIFCTKEQSLLGCILNLLSMISRLYLNRFPDIFLYIYIHLLLLINQNKNNFLFYKYINIRKKIKKKEFNEDQKLIFN